MLDLRDAVDEGAIIYFSFATSLDAVSVVTIGSLLIQDITAMIGARMNGPVANIRPVLFMPDETSVLEERAELLDNMLRQAREAKVWVWPVAQSLVSWPESTRNEVLSNARTKIAYNVPDKFTQDYLVGGLSKVPWLTFQTGTESDARAGGRREVTVGGRGFAKVDRGDQLTPGDLNLRDREAYIWFTGGTDTWLTIKPFRRHRVRNEEIEQDIVQIKTIARASILASLNSAGPEDAALSEAARLRVEHAKARGLARLNGDPAPTSLVEEEAMDGNWGDDLSYSAPAISSDVDPDLLADYRDRRAAQSQALPMQAPALPASTPALPLPGASNAPAFPFHASPASMPESGATVAHEPATQDPAPTVAFPFAPLPTAPVNAPAPGFPVAPFIARDPAPAAPADAPLVQPTIPATSEVEEPGEEGAPGSVSLLDSLKSIKAQTGAPEGFAPARRTPPVATPRPDWLPARRTPTPPVDEAAPTPRRGPSWGTKDDEASA
ncbi:hypothetical protein GCM10025867_46710 (plasmid) [Frondihabitans sucicola]|uniref:TraD/TraG TraM recognition site domain-containing protein n=1 Tax=Frondihabitans sucicola TaxID=1268041 RepID=A0ABM8GVJ3_9MICO|nr:hypothetical protein [Frondihabitans sucicola]BDZ52430.1 hypothetical protein GCM10025867_46710 [Frondihabitans sucicola]